MSKNTTATVVKFYPGQYIEITRKDQDLGVAMDKKTKQSLLLSAPPARLLRGTRAIKLWERVLPYHGAFAGDGEALNFEAGIEHDWREGSADDAEGRAYADKALDALDEKAGEQALMRALDSYDAPATMGMRLVVTTQIVVLVVLVVVVWEFLQDQGGIGGIIPQLSDGAIPGRIE